MIIDISLWEVHSPTVTPLLPTGARTTLTDHSMALDYTQPMPIHPLLYTSDHSEHWPLHLQSHRASHGCALLRRPTHHHARPSDEQLRSICCNNPASTHALHSPSRDTSIRSDDSNGPPCSLSGANLCLHPSDHSPSSVSNAGSPTDDGWNHERRVQSFRRRGPYHPRGAVRARSDSGNGPHSGILRMYLIYSYSLKKARLSEWLNCLGNIHLGTQLTLTMFGFLKRFSPSSIPIVRIHGSINPKMYSPPYEGLNKSRNSCKPSKAMSKPSRFQSTPLEACPHSQTSSPVNSDTTPKNTTSLC